MTEIVERVARTIYNAFYDGAEWPPEPFDDGLRTGDSYREAARAVIAAMPNDLTTSKLHVYAGFLEPIRKLQWDVEVDGNWQHREVSMGFVATPEPTVVRRVWRWAVPRGAKIIKGAPGGSWLRPLVEMPSMVDLITNGGRR